MSAYEQLVREQLEFTEDGLGEHWPEIVERLRHASLETEEVMTINQALHLCASVALQHNVTDARAQVQGNRDFDGVDPTTVITIAVLRFLLDCAANKGSREALAPLVRRFDAHKWLIGEKGMAALGIPLQPAE